MATDVSPRTHGWCLRLGPKRSEDDKYYSSLSSLLGGLIEHFTRRHLAAVKVPLDLQGFSREVTAALHSGLQLCQEAVEKGGLETRQRLMQGWHGFPTQSNPSLASRQAPGGAGIPLASAPRKKVV